MLCDAHNHLHDSRLDGLDRSAAMAELAKFGVRHVVVNGTSPDDWEKVESWARALPEMVVPSYGIHPWKIDAAKGDWLNDLQRRLDAAGDRLVGVGEVGLDRWIENPDIDRQLDVFRAQLAIAAERNLPVTIHCLRAWGCLLGVLREEALPARGFLIHSVGASSEIIAELAGLGAYFSVSGVVADHQKKKYQTALRAIPLDRLLIETDAPEMLPPPTHCLAAVRDPATGKALNHPFNLLATYVFVREFLEVDERFLVGQIFQNFGRLFLGHDGADGRLFEDHPRGEGSELEAE